jgi:hypothetical protein
MALWQSCNVATLHPNTCYNQIFVIFLYLLCCLVFTFFLVLKLPQKWSQNFKGNSLIILLSILINLDTFTILLYFSTSISFNGLGQKWIRAYISACLAFHATLIYSCLHGVIAKLVSMQYILWRTKQKSESTRSRLYGQFDSTVHRNLTIFSVKWLVCGLALLC